MWSTVAIVSLLALATGLVLGFAARKLKVEADPVSEQINAILPQTQCGQCSYAGCRPYSEAIAAGDADINRCPPGGEATIQALADLLGRDVKPLDADCGEEKAARTVAVIDEDLCIGCKLCIQACPVDAILGAPRHMHTVIAAECTGCDLCVEPCPVDCIEMVEVGTDTVTWQWPVPGGDDDRDEAA